MQNTGNASVEVHQVLSIRCPEKCHAELYNALRQYVEKPWKYVKEKEGVLIFERESGNGFSAAMVVLSSEPDNGYYKVLNITLQDGGNLNIPDYNNLLNDFMEQVMKPASKDLDCKINISLNKQSITDWTSQEAANELSSFSAGANKSTGSLHPSDGDRWRKFVIAAHKAQGTLNSCLLKKWLVEVEEWPSDTADELVSQYECGIDLLEQYDPQS